MGPIAQTAKREPNAALRTNRTQIKESINKVVVDVQKQAKTRTIMEEAMKGLTAEGINKMLSGAGPMVKGIMISTAGKLSSVELDMTPKANAPAKVLGGDATILGQYAEIDAILMVLRKPNEMTEEEVAEVSTAAADSASASAGSSSGSASTPATSAFEPNTYALPWPLHEESARGPILVVRMDEKSEPKDISAEEFTKFIEERAKTPIPADVAAIMEEVKEAEGAAKAEMEDEEGEEEDEDEDEDYKEEEEEGEEEEEEGEASSGLDPFTKQLLIQCLQGFEKKHGRKPNQEEVAGIMATLGMLPEGLDGEEADEEEGEGELEEDEDDANDADDDVKGGAAAAAAAPVAPVATSAAAAAVTTTATADAAAPTSVSDDLLLQLIELYKEQNDGKEPTDEHLKQWTATLAEANAEAAAANADAKENEQKQNEKTEVKGKSASVKRKAGDVDGPGPVLAPAAKVQKQE